MKWITWFSKKGKRTSRAHIRSNFLSGPAAGQSRTECGWPISTLVSNAPRSVPRCQACSKAQRSGLDEAMLKVRKLIPRP